MATKDAFASVDGLVLSRILCALGTIMDLASVGRCSKRLCEEVQTASDAWQKHADTLPECRGEREREQGAATTPTPPTASTTTTQRWHPPPACPAARLCRARLEHWRRVSFAHLSVERMRRLSELDEAERAVRRLTQEAAAEARTRARLEREASAIMEALRAAEAAAAARGGSSAPVQAWVSSAVQSGWDAAAANAGGGGGFAAAPAPSFVAAQGIDARVRLRQLEQEMTLSDCRSETIGMSLTQARRRVELERAKVRGLRDQGTWGPGGRFDETGGRVVPEPLLLFR